MQKIKIVVAEDHKMFRQSIISHLKDYHIVTVGEAENGNELLGLLPSIKPDIILLDIEMPGLDGTAALEIISKEYPEIKIIIVSLHNEHEFMLHFLQNGAHAFIPKDLGIETLINAIETVKKTGCYYDNMPHKLELGKFKKKNNFDKTKLSKRQTEILPMICNGKTNKEIAIKLKIVVKTVEAHRKIIYNKTNTKSAVELYSYALKNKFIKS